MDVKIVVFGFLIPLLIGAAYLNRPNQHTIEFGPVIGNRLMGSDKGRLGKFVAEVGEPTEFSGEIVEIKKADGDFKHLGMHLGIAYRSGQEGPRKFMRLVGVNSEVGKELMKIDFNSASETVIPVRLWGRPMDILEIRYTKGRVDPSPASLESSFLVERILAIR